MSTLTRVGGVLQMPNAYDSFEVEALHRDDCN